MKPSEYLGILAVVWIAPYQPSLYNAICGAVLFIASVCYFCKGK